MPTSGDKAGVKKKSSGKKSKKDKDSPSADRSSKEKKKKSKRRSKSPSKPGTRARASDRSISVDQPPMPVRPQALPSAQPPAALKPEQDPKASTDFEAGLLFQKQVLGIQSNHSTTHVAVNLGNTQT